MKFLVRLGCSLFNHPTPMSSKLEAEAIKQARLMASRGGTIKVQCYCGRMWWPIDPEWQR